MMSRISHFIAALLLSAPLLAAAADDSNAAEPRQEMMLGMQYTDAKHCHSKMGNETPQSIVGQLVAAHGLPGIDREKVMVALDAAAARGCSFNERDQAGLPPLQAAMLFNDADMVRYILAHGGSPKTKIERAKSEVDGMDAPAFMQWLLAQDVRRGQYPDRSAVQQALADSEAKKP